jgi:predicted TIM-barrel fold metal-dependent hydrolase
VRTTRREWFSALGLGAAGARVWSRQTPATRAAAPAQRPPAASKAPLALKDFQPRSMLHVPETAVSKARFPVIDVHCHVATTARHQAGVPLGEATKIDADVSEVVAMMDRRNIKTMVNLTGGYGAGLKDAVRQLSDAHPGRFVVFTEPGWDRFASADYPKWQGDEIARAKEAGARGLKILKTLGLYLREQVTSGPLVAIDDKRFDPMWEACGALGLPVAIHIADPEAFFLPVDRFNERYEELQAHPDWSFHGRDFPSFAQLIAARDRLLARHPKTTFIGLHVGHDSENLAAVSEALDRFPNFYVETAARIGELGRQPRAARRFFDRYQDRVLFGTDTSPSRSDLGDGSYPDATYRIYFRLFETDDEYFDYSPSPVPPQGRWRIYGLALPDEILRKFYFQNAARLIGLPA